MRQPVPFGKYLLLDRVSVGGMAEVFKAKSYGVEGFEKVIAIKRILPSLGEDRDFIKMFIDEAKIAGQLSHANICQIFELGRIDGAHFIAMEFIWGKDLLQIQNRFRRSKQIMSPQMSCYVMAKICEGLDYAHRKRDPLGRPLEIVHRDCSPQNILVSYEGEVKVIDFGIAKAASRSSRTMAGVLKGKFGYMSPEQVRGLPLDRRSDIFALGTMLYESATGERLFQGESDFSTLERVRNVVIVPPRKVKSDIPEEVERIILKALARAPEDRYQWCNEMHADLQRYLMSCEPVYTAKALGNWLKEGFSADLEREQQLMETYKRVGRDGLIAGVPAAEAKLDVVEHLGEAGTTDDPTILGGPNFDDLIEDAKPILSAGKQGRGGGEFGEEAPTEIFGELGSEALVAEGLAPPAAGSPPPAAPPLSGPAARTIIAAEAINLPQMAAMEANASGSMPLAAPVFTPSGLMIKPPTMGPAAMAHHNSGEFYQSGEFYHTGTQSVPRLPVPGARGQRRNSLIRDVGIGVGIAAFVLGLGIAAKLVFFGDKPETPQVAAAPAGTILVTVPDEESAEVAIDGKSAGLIAGGALTVETVSAGAHVVRVTRGDLPACEKSIELVPGKIQHVKCAFEPPAPMGLLALEGLGDGDAVVVDGERAELDKGAYRVRANVDHAVLVKRGEVVINEFLVKVAEGARVEHVLARHGVPAVAAVAAVQPDDGAAGAANSEPEVASAGAPGGPGQRIDLGGGSDSNPSATEVKSSRDAKTSDAGGTGGKSRDQGTGKTESASGGSSKPKDRDKDKAADKDKGGDADKAGSSAKGEGDSDKAAAPEVGYFLAYTTPFARVSIDGKDTGRTTPIAPRAKISLSPGKHRVTFIVGRAEFTYSVNIEAGKDLRFVQTLPVQD